MRLRSVLVVFVTLLLVPCAPAAAQHTAHDANAAPADSGMPLFRSALGPFTRDAGSRSRDAQAYFDQGFQLMYSFAPEEAVKSFREAQRRDPSCGMCFWGEAWARGAYLNGPMDSAGAPAAYTTAQRAKTLSGSLARAAAMRTPESTNVSIAVCVIKLDATPSFGEFLVKFLPGREHARIILLRRNDLVSGREIKSVLHDLQ